MYSFLLIGQSNMAGRGFIHEVKPIDNPHLYVLRNGRWRNMYVPVNGDRPFSGICLAESFADMCSRTYHVNVGLIPCADGGTKLDQWLPGELLYDHAVNQARLAMRTSNIAGILWHQGEADCHEDLHPHYQEKCTHIFESLRKDLNLPPHLPFIIGGLGDFLANRKENPNLKNYPYINHALQQMASQHDYIGYVPADGLTSNPDNLHFNSTSLREFGIRYFNKFQEMNTLIPVTSDEWTEISISSMEKL